MLNLEEFSIFQDFGKKENDLYESLTIIKEKESELFFVKKTSKYILENEIKRKYFENEVYVNLNYDHDNIVKFYEKKQILNDTYLIFEFANGGNLNDYFQSYQEKNGKPLPEEIVQRIIKQVSSALKYLYDNQIIFRNLSTDHIYLFFDTQEDLDNFDISKATFKIGNFNFSKILKDNSLTNTFIGIPLYMDPNILINSKSKDNISYGFKADVWSLGAICFELLTGITPFDGEDFDGLVQKVKIGTFKIPKKLNLSKEAINFIRGMLQYDPEKRFDINDVVEHDFLNKNVNEFAHEGYEEFGEVNENEIILNINN